jgi:hypothetical protein
MALIGIVHFAERLLNQTQENDASAQSNAKHAVRAQSAQNDDGDQFTPSTHNPGQDAGLFRVSNISLFSAAADFVFEQPAAQPTSATNVSDNTSQNAAANENGAGATNVAANTNAVPVASAAAAVAVPAAIANSAANAANDVTAELQNLNSTLASLGLSQAEINVVDRIAQVVRDFNPQAFNDLINQLQTLAQANSAQNAAQISAQSAAQNSARPATQTAENSAQAASNSDAQTGGFSIQELSIKFAGVEGTTQLSKNGKSAGAVEFSAYNLQVEEVQITFANGAGQTTQVQAPQTPAAVSQTQGESQSQPQVQAKRATV